MFDADERIAFVEASVDAPGRTSAWRASTRLITEHARALGASVMVKGLRAISDFDYEFQMAQLNRHLAAEIETVYLPASPQYSFVSSSGVREVAAWGGSVRRLGSRVRRGGSAGTTPTWCRLGPLRRVRWTYWN